MFYERSQHNFIVQERFWFCLWLRFVVLVSLSPVTASAQLQPISTHIYPACHRFLFLLAIWAGNGSYMEPKFVW
jgi:hypothetical protein